jgi:Fur family ferric uptake transcriptional regulator
MGSPRLIDAFGDYLREHGLPVTPQRLAVAEALVASERHLSAEELADEVGRRGRAVGTATVYRTIELLVRSGLAVERDFGEGFKRYETTRGMPQHEHLLCTSCGRVTELRDERLERMTFLVSEAHDFLRERHNLVIYGICADCRAAGRTAGAGLPDEDEP